LAVQRPGVSCGAGRRGERAERGQEPAASKGRGAAQGLMERTSERHRGDRALREDRAEVRDAPAASAARRGSGARAAKVVLCDGRLSLRKMHLGDPESSHQNARDELRLRRSRIVVCDHQNARDEPRLRRLRIVDCGLCSPESLSRSAPAALENCGWWTPECAR
jgi:hypothetical protein